MKGQLDNRTQKRRQDRAETYRRWKKAGLCTLCGRQPEPGKKTCEICLARIQAKKAVNPEKQRLANKKHYEKLKAAGVCPHCGKSSAPGALHCEDCLARKDSYNSRDPEEIKRRQEKRLKVRDPQTSRDYQNAANQRLREETFEHYGRSCVDCGESNPAFLTLDHLIDTGYQWRKDILGNRLSAGIKTYSWLRQNGWPEGFATRCYNCNLFKWKKDQPPSPYMWYRKLRQQVLDAYGRSCICCGEDRELVLGIDHLDGDGAKHRKEVKGSTFYAWLRKNGWPEGFAMMCNNCNNAKHRFGTCPHQTA